MKAFCSLLIAMFLFGAAAHAVEMAPEGTRARKLQRGFLNVALAPMEASTRLVRGTERYEGLEPSWFFGILDGAVFAVHRALVGAFEIATFPIRTDPVVEPEFAWQYLDSDNPS